MFEVKISSFWIFGLVVSIGLTLTKRPTQFPGNIPTSRKERWASHPSQFTLVHYNGV